MPHKLPSGLYALYDDGSPQRVLEAVKGGARTVQLRLKGTADRDALQLARSLTGHVPVLIIDDRVDLALLVGCGVHLGEEDLPVAEARRVLGPSALIGATCRSLADVERAKRDGADYAGVGPVFPSRTKSLPIPRLGLAGLAAICRQSPLPVVAISGIDETNIASVAKAGAHAAAVSSALFAAGSDPSLKAAPGDEVRRRAQLMLSLWSG